jgi:hypothetical protein
MRVIGALQLEELDTRGETARLSPETVQAMRDVLLVGGAARGLARLAVVSRDSRACCAASPLRAAPDFSVTPRRDDIVRSIVEYLCWPHGLLMETLRVRKCVANAPAVRCCSASGFPDMRAPASTVCDGCSRKHTRAACAGQLAASAY